MHTTETNVNTPVLSNCAKVIHPIDIASCGTSDIPNFALADTCWYRAPVKKKNGKNKIMYTRPPTVETVVATITQTVYPMYSTQGYNSLRNSQ